MAYPSGVSLAVVTVGNAFTAFGDGVPVQVSITPKFPKQGGGFLSRIVHQPTGWVMTGEKDSFTAEAGVEASFSVPHVDQPVWVDPALNAYTGWYYEVEIIVGNSRGRERTKYVQTVQPIVGQDIIDLDLIPDDEPGAPTWGPIPTVTSINGQTGAVTVDTNFTVTEPTPGEYVITSPSMSSTIMGLNYDKSLPLETQQDIASDLTDPGSTIGAVATSTYATLDAQGRQPVRKGELEINVKDHGVLGDGTTDDAPAIQSLIDSTTGGVTLFFPPGDYRIGAPIVLRDGVFLTGRRAGYGYLPSGSRWTVRFKALGSPASLVTAGATLTTGGVQGIDFEGMGTTSKGIHFPDATWCTIRDIHFNNFLDQFIHIEGGNATTIDNVLGVNGLKRPVAERTTRVGSVQVGGSDHWLSRIETGGGYTAGATSSEMFNTAYYFTGTSMFLYGLVGEFSETGFWFAPSSVGNRAAMCRADKGGGHGFVVEGKDNTFASCHVANMAREADNIYSGFRVTSGGRGSNFSACRVHYTSGYSNYAKYAFEDLTDGGQMQDRPGWAACTGQYRTSMFYTVPGGGTAPAVGGHPQRYAANLTTLDVTSTGIAWLGAYNTPTTITAFTGGVTGQRLILMGSNTNVTVAHNGSVSTPGSIYTNTYADKNLAANRAYEFVHYQGVWYEIA